MERNDSDIFLLDTGTVDELDNVKTPKEDQKQARTYARRKPRQRTQGLSLERRKSSSSSWRSVATQQPFKRPRVHVNSSFAEKQDEIMSSYSLSEHRSGLSQAQKSRYFQRNCDEAQSEKKRRMRDFAPTSDVVLSQRKSRRARTRPMIAAVDIYEDGDDDFVGNHVEKNTVSSKVGNRILGEGGLFGTGSRRAEGNHQNESGSRSSSIDDDFVVVENFESEGLKRKTGPKSLRRHSLPAKANLNPFACHQSQDSFRKVWAKFIVFNFKIVNGPDKSNLQRFSIDSVNGELIFFVPPDGRRGETMGENVPLDDIREVTSAFYNGLAVLIVRFHDFANVTIDNLRIKSIALAWPQKNVTNDWRPKPLIWEQKLGVKEAERVVVDNLIIRINNTLEEPDNNSRPTRQVNSASTTRTYSKKRTTFLEQLTNPADKFKRLSSSGNLKGWGKAPEAYTSWKAVKRETEKEKEKEESTGNSQQSKRPELTFPKKKGPERLIFSTSLRRSARNRSSNAGSSKRVLSREEAEKILFAYPPDEADKVIVLRADLERCDGDVFLNDSIIDFYLKYLLREHRFYDEHQTKRELKLKKALEKNVYVFNTFFFNRLVEESSNKRKRVGVEEKINSTYANVRKWTKKVDIFEKKFLFVPINQSLHWCVAIICNVNLLVNASQDHEVGLAEETPCILILDSLGGERNAKKYSKILREYLKHEWKSRKVATLQKDKFASSTLDEDVDALISADTMPSTVPKLPQQHNSYDCGVYLLEYVERFFKDCVRQIKFTPEDIHSKFGIYMSPKWFGQADIDKKRTKLKRLMQKKHEAYETRMATIASERGVDSEGSDDDEVVVMSSSQHEKEGLNSGSLLSSEDFKNDGANAEESKNSGANSAELNNNGANAEGFKPNGSEINWEELKEGESKNQKPKGRNIEENKSVGEDAASSKPEETNLFGKLINHKDDGMDQSSEVEKKNISLEEYCARNNIKPFAKFVQS